MCCCVSHFTYEDEQIAFALKKDLEATFHSFLKTYCTVDPTCFVPYDIFRRAWDRYKQLMGDGELQKLFKMYKDKYERIAGPIAVSQTKTGIHYDARSNMVLGVCIRCWP